MSEINQTEELLEMLKEDKELNLIEIEDLKNQKNILHFKLLTMKKIIVEQAKYLENKHDEVRSLEKRVKELERQL